jgi:hypothetical protein
MRSNRPDNPTRFTGSPTRALALIAALALVTLSLGAGLALANNGRPHVQAENTFTKWITATPNLPGEVKDMGGVVGGDVGDGAFAGTVLSGASTPGGPTVLNAVYGFNGSEHAFKALMHIVQTGAHAVLIGVVTDGWMAGHLVEGEYTMGACTGDLAAHGTCFSGTLDVMQAFKP